MNELDVVKCEVAVLDDSGLKEVYGIVPAVEKKCREIKGEVKKRIKDNGSLEGLKLYTENAGITVKEIEKFYGLIKEHISREDFISQCVTVNLTAVKKIAVLSMQAKALEDGEKKSKEICNIEIDNLAVECGERKSKQVIM